METVDDAPRVGLVLAGAAALGAYEVGVLSYVVDDVARALDGRAMPAVVSGTSAGAINAAALAAFADVPRVGAARLRDAWTELRLERTLRPSSIELLSMFLDVTGTPVSLRRAIRALSIRGGLLDPTPIARQIEKAPIARIGEHLRARRLLGVAVSATRVVDGGAVVFHDAASPIDWPRSERERVRMVAAMIGVEHVLASAAIPLLFPGVRIGADLYCDGGLRQMVPLSPALHLGADRLLVVNPLPAVRVPEGVPTRMMLTSPLFLAGKAINALFADRVEADLDRLDHMNALLRAGRRRFGPGFARDINAELVREGGSPLHEIQSVRVEPSRDLGVMAAEYVTSKGFRSRATCAAGLLLRWLADGDPHRTGDLIGYLLFDGGFTAELIALGRADAAAKHEELCALFGGAGVDRARAS